MTEYIGEWHTVTAYYDGDPDLEFDVEHPDGCPTETVGYLGEIPGVGVPEIVAYGCDMARALDDFEALKDITEPGTYRARCRLWSISLAPWIGSEEWDEAVEVESVALPTATSMEGAVR